MKKINTVITAAILLASTGKINGQTWRDKNEGLMPGFNAVSIYGEGTSILAANATLGYNNHMYHRPDTSTAFTASTSSFGGYAGILSQIVKAKGALFVGTTNGMYRSIDNGVSWQKSSGTNAYVYSLYAINDTLYGVAGATGATQMSTDTGQSWVNINYPGTIATTYVKANGVLYVGSNNGLKYTADNGANWTTPPFSSGLSGPIITGLASLAGSVYAACSTGVYKTIDNGANWNMVFPRSIFSLIAVDTSLIAGTNTWGIYRSNQAGTDWNTINTGLPFVGAGSYNAVNALAFNNEVLIASMQGDSAIYVTELAGLGLNPPVTSNIAEARWKQSDVTIFPVPSARQLTIHVQHSDGTPISIQISDVTGRTVVNTVSNNEQVQLQLPELIQGLYMVKISQGNSTIIKKLPITQ